MMVREDEYVRAGRAVWYIFYILEGILLLRFLLKLAAANPAAGFTQFVYAISQPFVSPFQFVLPAPQVGGNVFEWNTLLALLVYWFIAWAIIRLIMLGRPPRQANREHIEVRERQDEI
jgi:uncharacterized protein YggT (Ycf19 family)